MLGMIPGKETDLITALSKQHEAHRYTAPEACNWHGTYNVLIAHLRGRESEPWVAALLDVWQDKTTPEHTPSYQPWMEEARNFAAQCWCDPETEHLELNPVLAEAVAKRIAVWMQTSAEMSNNTEYYRGLLVRCGKAIGDRAYTCDDGSRSEDVLCARIPEIVECDYVNGAR